MKKSVRIARLFIASTVFFLPCAGAALAITPEECDQLRNAEQERQARDARNGTRTSPIQLPAACLSGSAPLPPDVSSTGDLDRDLKKFCGPILDQFHSLEAQTPQELRTKEEQKKYIAQTFGMDQFHLDYCIAAEMAGSVARRSNYAKWVWTGVATTCGVACIQGGAASKVCGYAYAGAATLDLVAIRKYEKKLEELDTEFTGSTTNSLKTAGTLAVSAMAAKMAFFPKAKNAFACAGAAIAGYIASTRFKTGSDAKKIAEDNLLQARKLIAKGPLPLPNDASAPGNARSGSRGGSTTPQGGLVRQTAIAGASVARENSDDSATDRCSKPLKAQPGAPGAQEIISCARSADSALPPAELLTEALGDPFRQASGQEFAQFVAANEAQEKTPAQALFASLSRNLDGAKASTLASAIKELASAAESDGGSSAYASSSGGGGAGAGSDGGSADMSATLAALMGQLGPNGGTQDESHADQETAFATPELRARMNREPAAVAEDRSLSLFERVTYRYSALSRRIHGPQFKLPGSAQP